MGKPGLGKMGNFSQIVPFFSDFPPVSEQFHTFLTHFPQSFLWQSPTIPHCPPLSPIFPHFPPFPPISPHFATIFSIFPIFLLLCG